MAQRHAGIKVEMPREHPPYIKVDIEIGRYLRAYDLVLRVRLFIKSVPSKRHTEVPLIVERQPPRQVHDGRSLKQEHRDGV